MTIEGVDYSRTPSASSPSVAALKEAGKRFVGRYAVNDKSPNGRGITAEEYQRMRAGGIDVFLYWEAGASWMIGGFEAGKTAAFNAQKNISENGMPPDMPVYFACDWDATPEDQVQIDACLRGCAEVIGPDRVGLYAGYFPLLRAMQNGTAKWLCQTVAWSGGNVLPQAHLYQYDTQGNYIDGTDVDLVRAFTENYGQASKFEDAPPPETQPALIWWTQGTDVGLVKRPSDGHVANAMLVQSYATTKRAVPLYDQIDGKKIGSVDPGKPVVIVGTTRDDKGKGWYFIRFGDDPKRAARARASSLQDKLPLT